MIRRFRLSLGFLWKFEMRILRERREMRDTCCCRLRDPGRAGPWLGGGNYKVDLLKRRLRVESSSVR